VSPAIKAAPNSESFREQALSGLPLQLRRRWGIQG